jgi:proteasome lid subunit RPN8/RPN11
MRGPDDPVGTRRGIAGGRAGSSGQVAVRARVELNRNLEPVPCPAPVLSELCNHALETAPEECCGLVIGSARQRFEQVHRITNVMTRMHLADPAAFPRDARHAFYMAELEYLEAQKHAEARGRRVTAVYHSHVEAGAYLSPEDLAYAEHPLFPFPRAAHIVVSVLGGRVKEAAIFEIDSAAGTFRESSGRPLGVVEP